MLVAESSKAYQRILHQRQLQLQQQRAAVAAEIADEEQRRRNSWPKQQITGGTGATAHANMPLSFQQQQQNQQAYLHLQAQQQQRLIQLQQQHQLQHQLQQQKRLLSQQQPQLQQQNQQQQQQQLYKQRVYVSSSPTFNTQVGFPSPHPQTLTPQQRGANALNFVKALNQNNAATTASSWSYASHHPASTSRLSF
jgi:hypothetical protein